MYVILTMTKIGVAAALCLAFVAGLMMPRLSLIAGAATPAANGPSQGWNLHIDAQRHFGNHPSEIAHHWCKNVSDGLTECQIYNSDAPDAHLIAVETIVGPATFKSFPAQEQALWHYHKTEIPKVNATLPGMSPADAKKTIDAISDSYGKVWLLFDPLDTNGLPTGQPVVTVLK